MRTAMFLICLLLTGVLLLTAGCTEEAIADDTPATSVPTTTIATAVATPSVSKYISASVEGMQKHIVSPPYWDVTVRVENWGPVDVFHVITLVQLVDEGDGTVIDWKAKDFECITAGDHKTFTVKMYGEEDRQYRAEVQITSSQDDR